MFGNTCYYELSLQKYRGNTFWNFNIVFLFNTSTFSIFLRTICFPLFTRCLGNGIHFHCNECLFRNHSLLFFDRYTFFGKKYIYRLNKFLIPKRYSYKNVIRYRMNYSSGIIHTRYVGPKKVITYDFEIYFNDKMYSEFSVNKHNNKKITYIKKLLEENHCKKNGKIKT